MPIPFDLEKAIAAWRRPFKHNRAFSRDDIDELEGSLRDRVEALMEGGKSEEAAFNEGLRRMGTYGTAEAEYRKVYWGKLRRRRQLLNEGLWRFSMVKNYLKIAFRNLRRQKGYAFINVFGLAVGLACSFFILLWVTHTVRYDRFHERGDRLYRVMRHSPNGTGSFLPKPLADVMETNLPEVEHALLLSWKVSPLLTRGGDSFREDGHYVGPAFFEVFSFPLLEGDPATILTDPASVAISEAAAERMFGTDWRARGVVGQAITVDHRKDFQVSGVFADFPETSTLQADVLLPVADFFARNAWADTWDKAAVELYVELGEGASAAEVDAKIAGLMAPEGEGENPKHISFLQPFEDMHLYGDYEGRHVVGGRIEYVRIFVIVAVFLLFIAAINFMNLATARSGQRAKEIGVRKAVGAGKRSVAGQFLLEAMLLALVAFALALALVAALLPSFGDLTGISLSLGHIDLRFLLAGLSLALVVGLLAGSYPALYLSSFRPVVVLRGTFRQGRGPARFRQGLVVSQFALSTLLVVGTLIVSFQMDYIRTKKLGLDRANVVYMTLDGPAQEQFDTFRQELQQRPGIEAVTASNQNPLDLDYATTDVAWDGKPDDADIEFDFINTDYDFVETMRMTLAVGRSFSRAFAGDGNNIMINQRAAEVMGMDDPVGKAITMWGQEGQIIGVVEDFHTASLYTAIEPTILRLDPANVSLIYVRTAPGQTPEALASLEAVYEQFNAGYPFDYDFLDMEYDAMYKAEAVMGALTRLFALVAIFVAGLGLFGLVSFTAERRTKEIGVRKVLGASVTSVVALLSSDFLKLVGLAFILSVPLAYFVMQRWLEDFAYRIEIGPGVFLLTGGLVVLIAVLTVSNQAIRAALADPVKSLRYE